MSSAHVEYKKKLEKNLTEQLRNKNLTSEQREATARELKQVQAELHPLTQKEKQILADNPGITYSVSPSGTKSFHYPGTTPIYDDSSKIVGVEIKKQSEVAGLVKTQNKQGKTVMVPVSKGVLNKLKSGDTASTIKKGIGTSYGESFREAMVKEKLGGKQNTIIEVGRKPTGKSQKVTFVPETEYRMETPQETALKKAQEQSDIMYARGEWEKMNRAERALWIATMPLSKEGMAGIFEQDKAMGEHPKYDTIRDLLRGVNDPEKTNLLFDRIVRYGYQKSQEKSFADTVRNAISEGWHNPVTQMAFIRFQDQAIGEVLKVIESANMEVTAMTKAKYDVYKAPSELLTEKGILSPLEGSNVFEGEALTEVRIRTPFRKRIDAFMSEIRGLSVPDEAMGSRTMAKIKTGSVTSIQKTVSQGVKVGEELRSHSLSDILTMDRMMNSDIAILKNIESLSKSIKILESAEKDMFVTKAMAEIPGGYAMEGSVSNVFKSEFDSMARDIGKVIKTADVTPPSIQKVVMDQIEIESIVSKSSPLGDLSVPALPDTSMKEIKEVSRSSSKIFSFPKVERIDYPDMNVVFPGTGTKKDLIELEELDMSPMVRQVYKEITGIDLDKLNAQLNNQLNEMSRLTGQIKITGLDSLQDILKIQEIVNLTVTDITPDITTDLVLRIPGIPGIDMPGIPPQIIPTIIPGGGHDMENIKLDLDDLNIDKELKNTMKKLYVPSYYAIEFNIEKELGDVSKLLSSGLGIRPINISKPKGRRKK